MARTNERVNKAQDIALERLEYITDCYEAPDFVEVTGKIGGDTITLRVRDDGTVSER